MSFIMAITVAFDVKILNILVIFAQLYSFALAQKQALQETII